MKNLCGFLRYILHVSVYYNFYHHFKAYTLFPHFPFKVKSRLDLDYLQSIGTQSDDSLKIILQFDLVRMDCQYREYQFSDEEQYNSFLDTVQPIFVKNRQKKLLEMMLYCEVCVLLASEYACDLKENSIFCCLFAKLNLLLKLAIVFFRLNFSNSLSVLRSSIQALQIQGKYFYE